MKIRLPKSPSRAFTIVEFLILLATIAILAFRLIPCLTTAGLSSML